MANYFRNMIKRMIPSESRIGYIKTITKVCPVHGEYESTFTGRLSPGTTLDQKCFVDVTESPCMKCRDEQGSINATEIVERNKWLSHYKEAGVPDRFKESSLKTFEIYDERQAKAIEIAKDWIHGKKLNLIFLGRGGTGKSNILCASVRILAYYKHSVKYITEEQFCSEIKATYSDGSTNTEFSVMEKYANYEYLVIDEIGRSVGTEKDLNLISTLIIKRYENLKHTAMASNLTQEKLEKRFDSPVYRKLTESVNIFLAAWTNYSTYLDSIA